MRNSSIEMFFLVRLQEAIENGAPLYDCVAGEEGEYGIMHQDYEVSIIEPADAPHIQGEATVTRYEINGPVKAKLNFSQAFGRPQFHKAMTLPYLREKEKKIS